MKIETFFDNFEVLAEAPNGVKNLRELILQLAVRGKLVAQDEKDEPAIVLLEKIKSEKERLIGNKIITNSKLLPETLKIDVPYELPRNWNWIQLKDYCIITMGQSPESEFYNKEKNGLPFYQGKTEFGKVYPTPIVWCNKPGKIAEKNDVLISVRAPVGPTNICPEKSCIGRGLASIRTLLDLSNFYLMYVIRAFESNIAEMGVGSTFTAISKSNVETLFIPVPPAQEQHRIVAKVDQLMSLCDELEARQQKKRESRAHINSAALDRLLAARAPGEFAEGWRRISDNFDLLYDAPENVGALRKAILQLAVLGKLVEQDERDEPADVLLERINDENKIQIKNQKNKETPLFSPIKLTPFELPENWKWCRMGEIAEIRMGNSPPGDSYNENGNGIPLINGPVEFSKGPFGYTTKTKFTTKPTKLCEEKDLLICVRGSTTGRTNIAGFPACIGRGVAAIRARIHQEYVNYLVLSMRQQIYDLGTGSTFPSVSYGQLMELPIPLPPLAEQRRIVARLDQLMSLCDALEAGLLRSQADSERLMEAVVGRMLAGE